MILANFLLVLERRLAEFLFEDRDEVGAVGKARAHTAFGDGGTVIQQLFGVGQALGLEKLTRGKPYELTKTAIEGGGADVEAFGDAFDALNVSEFAVDVVDDLLYVVGEKLRPGWVCESSFL